MRRTVLSLSLLAACAGQTPPAEDTQDAVCVPNPPDDMLRHPGRQDDGSFLTLDGRLATSAGPDVDVPGFPDRVVTHPTLPVAYVSSDGTDDRLLLVIDTNTLEILQTVDRGQGLHGLALTHDGTRLYSAGGAGLDVLVYDIDSSGQLTLATTVPVEGYASGLALSEDDAHLYVADFLEKRVVDVETAGLTVARKLDLTAQPWDMTLVPSHHALMIADLFTPIITVIDTQSWSVSDEIDVPLSTASITASPDGSRVWVASARQDRVTALDGATHDVLAQGEVALEDWVGDEGQLTDSNVNSVTIDAARGRLYATRGADNAIAVLDLDTLAFLGAIPAPAYPTWSALTSDGAKLVVAGGHGGGTGPTVNQEAYDVNRGSVSAIPLDGMDLEAQTQVVADAFRRPIDLFDFTCESEFPVPVHAGEPTSIQHVVVIVKENKTFDCYFGDLGGDADAEPENVRWGKDVTPNLHALATRYGISDNFYDQVDDSDEGHLFLTQGHLTDLDARLNIEQSFTDALTTYPIGDSAVPRSGNLFTSMIDHGVDFRIFGEVVGTFFAAQNGEKASKYSDLDFPGGPFLDQAVADELKAKDVAAHIAAEGVPSFMYVLLPDDHTVGTHPGQPTPESMVADNDYATGIVIDALAKRPEWASTAVFIVQDDPQGCNDHVDGHRSFVIVAGPYARRGYVSHVHASFLSLYATIERILNLPPLGRADASAAPLWDMFTQEADTTPYAVLERTWPYETNPVNALGAEVSQAMDFRGPDRNPGLGPLLDAYRLWRMGRLDRAEAERRVAAIDNTRGEVDLDDADAFERDFTRLRAWSAEMGEPVEELPAWMTPRGAVSDE